MERTLRFLGMVTALFVVIMLYSCTYQENGPVSTTTGPTAGGSLSKEKPIVTSTSVTPGPSTASHSVPVRGRFTGTATVTHLSVSEPLYRVDVNADGIVTHLGRARATYAVPQFLFDPVNRELTVLNTTWTGTITAANGDQVFAQYTLRTSTVPFTVLGDFAFSTDLALTGGTGRFQGATGVAVGFATGNIFTQKFTVGFDGTGALAVGP